jgi:hypothetical protein
MDEEKIQPASLAEYTHSGRSRLGLHDRVCWRDYLVVKQAAYLNTKTTALFTVSL